MSREKRVTVFTPTYNRVYTLDRLYDSLRRQTDQSFVWLIVDDGSTDNTGEIVGTWISEGLVEICYHKQANGGKPRAHNKGVDLCNTELFICVDSDDYLTDNAVERFIAVWDGIGSKQGVCGIVALKGDTADRPIGTPMPLNVHQSPLCDLYGKHGFRGDTALLFRTDVLRRFPFVVAEGETFIGEGYVYLQIDQHYSLHLLNEVLYIAAYLPDGYSRNIRKLIKRNPRSYTLLKRQAVVFSKTLRGKYRNSVSYLIGCMLSKEQHPIQNAPEKLIACLAYPLSLLLFWTLYR